ncbi:MAG: DM13 domain-containing protein [Shimia sp.]
MTRLLKTILPAFLVGIFVGAAGWYLFSPLLSDNVVEEQLEAAAPGAVLASGTFTDADRVHQGMGQAQLVTRADGRVALQLSDFEVTNGPDLKVYLSAHPDPTSSADVKGADFLSLGTLKGNVGDQSYLLPEGVDAAAYGSVVIWCEQFGVLFSPAPLA